MPADFPVHQIPLPDTGLAYTLPADEVLGPMGWIGLRSATIDMLRAVFDSVGIETVAWLCPLAGMNAEGKPEHLIGLVFTFDPDEVPNDAGEAVERHAGPLPLHPAGHQAPPDMAFPAFLAREGVIHRAWLNDPEHQVCLYLDQDAPGGEVQNIGVETREELALIEPDDLAGLRIDFPPEEDLFMPAISQLGPDELTEDILNLERLKIAFSWQFVYMVMNADGHVDEREKAFMARLFPDHLLAAVDLVDAHGEFKEPGFTLARTEALKVLPSTLSMPERVDLLRTLKQAAWADGVLVPEEAEVYEAAAEMLGVPMEAATQL